MRRVLAYGAVILSSACQAQTVPGYGAPDTVWRLVTLGGAPFDAAATMSLSATGRIAGNAPCNSYFGAMRSAYPAFDAPVIAASKRACKDLKAEGDFFAALGAATTAERTGNTLILSDETGARLVFTRAE